MAGVLVLWGKAVVWHDTNHPFASKLPSHVTKAIKPEKSQQRNNKNSNRFESHQQATGLDCININVLISYGGNKTNKNYSK